MRLLIESNAQSFNDKNIVILKLREASFSVESLRSGNLLRFEDTIQVEVYQQKVRQHLLSVDD